MEVNSTSTSQSGDEYPTLDYDLAIWWLDQLSYICVGVTSTSVVTGLLSTVLTVLFMPTLTSVKLKAKLFYLSIAVSLIPTYIFQTIFLYFMTDVLTVFSNVDFAFDGVSLATCHTARFFSNFSENAAAFLTLLFALERLVVVTRPFNAYWFNAKRSAYAICCVVLQAALVNCAAFVVYHADPNDQANATCTPRASLAGLVLVLFVIDFLMPNSLLLIVAAAITVALQKSQRQNAQHFAGNTQGATKNLAPRGRKSTRILIIMASARCVTYLPWSVLYIAFRFVADPTTSFVIRIYANFFYVFSELLIMADFLVYLICIEEFRRRIFCCKQNNN